ncbi:hypothetical protein SADUNF_Sadunf08G0099400 [Salix dunnii]|uniref:Uncharacterized protein n=1 Tax=Salix dunnii TaxID=1413687 RepID=A0A835JY66_9ROSI|nr:hypothetical protein SADUNF_Sadunf08G0099400 [Salix dunnii]
MASPSYRSHCPPSETERLCHLSISKQGRHGLLDRIGIRAEARTGYAFALRGTKRGTLEMGNCIMNLSGPSKHRWRRCRNIQASNATDVTLVPRQICSPVL